MSEKGLTRINLRERFVDGNPEMPRLLEEARSEAEIAQQAYDLRTGAGLGLQELAKRSGATAEAIESLEAGDYEGDALALLRRIAAVVGKRVEIRCIDREEAAAG